ncbi:MAG: hypothetical protein EOM21_17155 [Gammaproteobacteria bacterium]|nr:hypothetical protein [Gammaproteobacteria bacterium]
MADAADKAAPPTTGQHGGRRPGAGRRTAAEESASGPYGTLAKAKAKNELFKANLAELEFKQRTGQLLPAEEVSRVWAEKGQIIKERLLSLPSRLAPDILRMSELREVERCLRDALHGVLDELSRGDTLRKS